MIVRVLPQLNNSSPSADTAPMRICNLEEVPVGLGRAFAVGGRTIALFRTRANKVFAFDNRCPHKGGPLSEGMLAGESVVCPLHAFRFDMHNGQCDQPGVCTLKTYPIELRGNDIYLLSLD